MTHKKGFTLIELLVVIAIIALLLAVLTPALRKAKFAGQAVVCRSNLKSIGMAAILYAEDHGNTLPRNNGVWLLLFRPYITGLAEIVPTAATENQKLPDTSVFNCPSYPDKEQRLDYVESSWLDGIDEADDDIKKTKVSDWITPSAKVYLADNEYGEGNENWRSTVITIGDMQDLDKYDVWHRTHLPTGPDFDDATKNSLARRVARARHNRGNYNKESDFEVPDGLGGTQLDNPNKNIGCNYLFLDGHSDWIRANDSTEKIWRPGRM